MADRMRLDLDQHRGHAAHDERTAQVVLDDTLGGLRDEVDGVARLLAELEKQPDAGALLASRKATRLEGAIEHMAQAAEELGHLRERLWRHSSIGWHSDPEFSAWGMTPEAAIGYLWKVEDLQDRCIPTADRVMARIVADGLEELCDPAILSLWRRPQAERQDRENHQPDPRDERPQEATA